MHFYVRSLLRNAVAGSGELVKLQNAAQALAFVEQLEALVDLAEGQLVGDVPASIAHALQYTKKGRLLWHTAELTCVHFRVLYLK